MTFRDPNLLVRWLFLDMNSYFASIEQEMNPSLRGKPIAVVPVMTDTTCCIAVSSEGKRFGVKTGTQVAEAKQLCPKMQFIEGDHGHYIQYHNKIVQTVESLLPVTRVCSIDEMACRLMGSQQVVATAEALSLKIKNAIRQQVGSSLRCSIGVAPNRYLAKIAADMKKPDGFTAIRPCDLPRMLYSLSLRDLTGVGSATEARLNRKMIFSVERLFSMSPQEMTAVWGSVVGEEMWHLLRGEELPEKEVEQKSISHSHVLPPELRHEPGALQVLKKLTAQAALRLRREGFWASNLQIFVRFRKQNTWKAKCSFTETQDTLVFIHSIKTLWQGLPEGPLYAVGVVLSGLVPESLHSPSLFDDPKRNSLIKTLDSVNDRFGKNVIHFGAIHDSNQLAPLRIAFTQIPDESEA